MNSAVNYYSAAQHQADAIREARRNPPRRREALATPPASAPSGLLAVLTRRITRPHALLPVLHRPS